MKNKQITKVDSTLNKIEVKFFNSCKNFPMPTQRDMTVYFWEVLRPIIAQFVNEVLKK